MTKKPSQKHDKSDGVLAGMVNPIILPADGGGRAKQDKLTAKKVISDLAHHLTTPVVVFVAHRPPIPGRHCPLSLALLPLPGRPRRCHADPVPRIYIISNLTPFPLKRRIFVKFQSY